MNEMVIIQYRTDVMDWRECGRAFSDSNSITRKLQETYRAMSLNVGPKRAQHLKVRAIGSESKRLYDML